MKINQVLVESAGATVAFAFGRFNPAHQGHIEVWRTVEQAGANWFIGTNSSTLGPNDPLTFQQKSAWMEEIYPAITGHIVAEQTVLSLAAYIFKKTRKNERATVAYITDATDWAWSGKLLNQYNGVEGAHGYYKFAEIAHVPSPRVSSATALRDAARADDKVAFYHDSGTDPKSKVSGLTYFDTVKQAVEKYPLPVKRGQKVKEAPDANFVGFMNKAMNTRQDNKPLVYDPKTVMSMDTMPGYKKAFKFGMDVIKKMDPDTKQEFANAPDDTLFSYMMNIAEKKGYAPEQFMSEDLDEVTSEFEEIFHDPDMEGWTWTDLLRDMIGMEPRALSKANVQAHKKEFSHAQQMAAKGPGPIDPSKLKAVTRSDTKQTEIWYPVNTYNEAQGWVVVATGFQNKEQAEQKLTQMQQDPRVNTQIQAALDKKKNESVQQGVAEEELAESTSLETTLKAIINDISEPVTSTYENLKYLAKKYVKDHGKLDRGWNMVAMGPGSKWVEQFYKDKLKNELYDLIRYNSRYTVELQQFLRGVEINGELDVKRSFSNMARELPPILVTLGDKLQSPQLSKSAQRWMQNLKDYQMYLASLEDDEEDDYTPTMSTPRSTVPGQQNAQVEKIVNDILAKLPKNVSGEIRNIVSRSSNKLQALQQELTNRNLSVKESSEQKTVAKTWDQMTPQEKISGVKGRTAWNEKTQRYYTVFDVPVKNIKEDEDDEQGEVKKTGQLIPFPAGTTKVHVSDVYDWYKLGMVISDLDDADPKMFGQGAPQTVIAFGSEEEESKLLPLLQRLGLRVDDIDPEGTDEIGEAYHAGELYEYLKKVHGKWALVSKSNPKKVLQYYRGGDEKPSDEWVNKVERRVHSFESTKK
jgi:hypothetical protein